MVGPLFGFIIRQQFERLRDGDRYFFTHSEDRGIFSRGLKPLAKKNVLKRNLASILIDNIPEIVEIQDNCFKVPTKDNPLKKREEFSKLDFEEICREEMDPSFGNTGIFYFNLLAQHASN